MPRRITNMSEILKENQKFKEATQPTPQAIHTEKQKPVKERMQKSVNTEDEGVHKQTIIIKESLSRRLKMYAASKKGETISNVTANALEKYLNEMENR